MMRIISYDPIWRKLVDAKVNKTELTERLDFQWVKEVAGEAVSVW